MFSTRPAHILATEHSQALLPARSFSGREKVKMESEITHVCSLKQMFLDSNEIITSRNGLLLMQMLRLLTQRICRPFLYVITKCCFKLIFFGGVGVGGELYLRSS